MAHKSWIQTHAVDIASIIEGIISGIALAFTIVIIKHYYPNVGL